MVMLSGLIYNQIQIVRLYSYPTTEPKIGINGV